MVSPRKGRRMTTMLRRVWTVVKHPVFLVSVIVVMAAVELHIYSRENTDRAHSVALVCESTQQNHVALVTVTSALHKFLLASTHLSQEATKLTPPAAVNHKLDKIREAYADDLTALEATLAKPPPVKCSS